jgi:squalene-hopene/tetraprenyl-beta-curcumene cyclase
MKMSKQEVSGPGTAMSPRSSRRLASALDTARQRLLAERCAAGHWTGELSTSALSTATAVSAWSLVRNQGGDVGDLDGAIEAGIGYLASRVNSDGGWGDTDRSDSNIATTMLVQAAFRLAKADERYAGLLERAAGYLVRHGGVAGLRRRYGRDKTFAVPILTNQALAGLASWSDVSPLPFELACLPQRFYRFVRLPVVSYAVPALVAMGQARYFHQRPFWPWMRWIRHCSVKPSLRVLQAMQPTSGGYLEAAPLTSFVVMSLAATGRVLHPVVRAGVRFLLDSRRPDGSLPIDTNLATWTTSLAVNALAASGEDVAQLNCLDWLLSCQHRRRHPFTGAQPGGWGWSDLSGAVPDADDTPAALLALAAWHDAPSCSAADRVRIHQAAGEGLRWLAGLQNRDGGWPTFCRGWGRLPFDRSGADLTAHALRAWCTWREHPQALASRRRVARGFRFLKRQQRPDGSWVPLWFGNQDHPAEENPVYGTAKVLLAYAAGVGPPDPVAQRAIGWLCRAQNQDGSWAGGPGLTNLEGRPAAGSVEETALAIEALLAFPGNAEAAEACRRGLAWLIESVETGRYQEASPIGFYFAKLWYYERLYPLIFTVAALGQAMRPSAHEL